GCQCPEVYVVRHLRLQAAEHLGDALEPAGCPGPDLHFGGNPCTKRFIAEPALGLDENFADGEEVGGVPPGPPADLGGGASEPDSVGLGDAVKRERRVLLRHPYLGRWAVLLAVVGDIIRPTVLIEKRRNRPMADATIDTGMVIASGAGAATSVLL